MIMYDFVFKGKYNPFLYFPLFCAFASLVEPNVKERIPQSNSFGNGDFPNI